MSNFQNLLKIADDFKNRLKGSCSGDASEEGYLAKSWKKAFLIILLQPQVDAEINIETALKLAIVQDLAEGVSAEDLEKSDYEPEKKKRKALKSFVKSVLEDDSIYQLYKELGKNESLEAQFVNSLNENLEESEDLFWVKSEESEEETYDDEENEDTDEDYSDEESEEECEDDDECFCGCEEGDEDSEECDCECDEDENEEEKDGKKDLSVVYDYLNKIADILNVDFKKDKKDKDHKKDKKDKKKDKDHKKDKHKDKKDKKKDKKHKEKD